MSRPQPRQAVVIQSVRINPTMQRIVLGGEDLRAFPAVSAGAYVKLMFDKFGNPLSQPTDMGEVAMRTYTVSHFDADTAEMTLDMVIHAHDGKTGPASAWATSAKPGDIITLAGPGSSKGLSEDEVSHIRNRLPKSLQDQIGRNHIYLSQSEVSAKGSLLRHVDKIEVSTQQFESCPTPLRIGMVDTHVTTTHPLLSHIVFTQASFIVEQREGQDPRPNQNNGLDSDAADSKKQTSKASELAGGVAFSSDHGTAVASLLAASMPESSQVFNASVFYSRNSVSQGATLMSLIEGLNYLASQQVDAINMSLAGPDNPVLARVIKQLDESGIQIIAAVGNEGPASLPLYPAAYPETLGITAVDKSHAIYRWANQGDYVDFAAVGVSVEVAHPDGKVIRQTGTSMASPRATALYACFLRTELERNAALLKLQQLALDTGPPGRDSVFGFGVLP